MSITIYLRSMWLHDLLWVTGTKDINNARFPCHTDVKIHCGYVHDLDTSITGYPPAVPRMTSKMLERQDLSDTLLEHNQPEILWR